MGVSSNTWFGGWIGESWVMLLSYQPDPNTTWICVAVDAGGKHFGGKAVVTPAAASVVTLDNTSTECDANPASRIFQEDGAVGPVTFDVDINRFTSGDVWICVKASNGTIAKRLKINTSSLPGVTFLPDDAASFPYAEQFGEQPPPGSASSACQAAPTGRTRILNFIVGNGHYWLDTWSESPSRSHVCVRQEQRDSPSSGGRLTFDATGGQTLATVDEGSDFGPCETNILTLSTPPLMLRTHAGATPAWVCARFDTIFRRIKVDAAGGQGIATFTPDA